MTTAGRSHGKPADAPERAVGRCCLAGGCCRTGIRLWTTAATLRCGGSRSEPAAAEVAVGHAGAEGSGTARLRRCWASASAGSRTGEGRSPSAGHWSCRPSAPQGAPPRWEAMVAGAYAPQGCKPCDAADMANAKASRNVSVAEVRAGPATAGGPRLRHRDWAHLAV